MENVTVKGRVISLTQVMCSGIEVIPGGMPRAGGAYHAMDVAVSGQPMRLVSGTAVRTVSGSITNVSGNFVIMSGRVDLATKIAGEDLSGDVMKVVVMSTIPQEVRISGQAVIISGQIVRSRISGQAVVVSGQIVRTNTSGNVAYFQSGTENIRHSGQGISINSAQFVSGLHGMSGRTLNQNIFAADIRASYPPSMWRTQVAMGAAGQLTATIVNDGVGDGGISGYSTQRVSLNDGVDLTSGALYIFDVINQSGDKFNLQYSVDSPVNVVRVHEITAGTQ